MLRLAARWLKNEPPFELEFEGISEGPLQTRTAAASEPGGPKRHHSPKELVALGIAGCTGVDVVSILKKMRQPLEDLTIETELSQTTEHPRVFSSCKLIYRFSGDELEVDRVVRAVALSYGKYCGVSAMIKRSGCSFEPVLFINDHEHTEALDSALTALADEQSGCLRPGATAALLITGNEILSGKTLDTNGRFLSRNLIEMGYTISERRTLGDDREALVQCLRELLKTNDLLFMTGGLGPTKDDLTSEVVAAAFSVPLAFSQEAWNVCLSAFEKLGRTEIPESNRKQAVLPEGSVVLHNPLGTAAGFALNFLYEGRNRTVVALPGVPWECEAMFDTEVRTHLPGTAKAFHEWGPWQIWGVGESAMQSLIRELEEKIKAKLPQVEFSFQAHAGYLSYSFRTPALDAQQSAPDLSEEIEGLERLLGDKLLYRGRQSLVERLFDSAKNNGTTFALAESCTGGRIAAELTSLSGSSEFFLGGMVAYSNEAKMSLLEVSATTLSAQGAVSVQTAGEMARGAQKKFNARVALSVTGIAGPLGGSDSKPVGTVCYALSLQGLFADPVASKLFFDRRLGQLLTQGWTLIGDDEPVLVVEKRFGAHLTRDVLQKRATLFGLCSLVALVEAMRS